MLDQKQLDQKQLDPPGLGRRSSQLPGRARAARQRPRLIKNPRASGAAVIFAGALIASCGTTAAAPLKTGSAATPTLNAPGQLKHQPSTWWQQFLAASKDLGPSRSPLATVIMDLGPRASSALQAWASAHGLRAQWYVGHSVAELSAKPARLGVALGVRIDDFRAPDRQKFYAATTQPGVPAALHRVVTSVGRVSDYQGLSTAYVGPGGLDPQALLQAYDANPLRALGYNGAGETIVAFEIDNYVSGDLNTFANKYGLPSFTSQNFSVNGGEAGKAGGETDMDLESIREIAPAAKIVYYNIFQKTAGQGASDIILNAFNNANKLYPAAIWSLSIGSCEKAFTFADLNAENQAAAAAVAKGTTIFAASGDTAGLECVQQPNWGTSPSQKDVGVWTPAVLPAVTGVGATALSVSTSGAYLGESAWFYSALGQGTSGGTSTLFAQPSWQVGQGLPKPSTQVARQVPDVAAVGDPITGTAIYEGQWEQGGGTSLATPIWAGFTALIDQYLRQHSKPPVGFLNPYLYYFAGHTQKFTPFHLVTTGGNNIWRNTNGYNQTTGLGTPDVYNLARDILAQEGGH